MLVDGWGVERQNYWQFPFIMIQLYWKEDPVLRIVYCVSYPRKQISPKFKEGLMCVFLGFFVFIYFLHFMWLGISLKDNLQFI